jgi:hypothetical protein
MDNTYLCGCKCHSTSQAYIIVINYNKNDCNIISAHYFQDNFEYLFTKRLIHAKEHFLNLITSGWKEMSLNEIEHLTHIKGKQYDIFYRQKYNFAFFMTFLPIGIYFAYNLFLSKGRWCIYRINN